MASSDTVSDGEKKGEDEVEAVIAANLKRLRIRSGLRQLDAGQVLGLSEQSAARLENLKNGRVQTPISAARLALLAKAMNIPPQDFFENAVPLEAGNSPTTAEEKLARVKKLIVGLTEEEADVLLPILDLIYRQRNDGSITEG